MKLVCDNICFLIYISNQTLMVNIVIIVINVIIDFIVWLQNMAGLIYQRDSIWEISLR